MYIYLITNLVNGKIYVGKTVNKNLYDYLSVKRWAARYNQVNGMPLISALRKHGMDNFIYEVIDTAATNEELCFLEREWIAFLDARNPEVGYNITAGGSTGRLGMTASEETKRKIGLANKGRKPKGYARTAEHREQLRQRMAGNNNGVKITPEIVKQWNDRLGAEWRSERSRKAAAARWESRVVLR